MLLCDVDLVIKFGGSAITVKDRFETLNTEALRCATDLIKRCAEKKLTCVVVHGAGSFGHHQAKEYQVNVGWKAASGTAVNHIKKGFSLTRQSVTKLHHKVLDCLIENDVPAVGLSACGLWSTENGRVVHYKLGAVNEVIQNGFIPVLHGDCVYDTVKGCSILSGDTIIQKISEDFNVGRIVFLTSVLGIYDKPPLEFPDSVVLKQILVDRKGEISYRQTHKHTTCTTKVDKPSPSSDLVNNTVSVQATHCSDAEEETKFSRTQDSVETQCHDSVETQCHDSVATQCHDSVATQCHDSVETQCHDSVETQCHDSVATQCHDSVETQCHDSVETQCHDSVETQCHDSVETQCHDSVETQCHDSVETQCSDRVETQCHDSVETQCHDSVETQCHDSVETQCHDSVATQCHDSVATQCHDSVETQCHDSVETQCHDSVETQCHDSVATQCHDSVETQCHDSVATQCSDRVEISTKTIVTQIDGKDVTGGMMHKIKCAVDIVRRNKLKTSVYVCKVGSTFSNDICLYGECERKWEDSGTVISYSDLF